MGISKCALALFTAVILLTPATSFSSEKIQDKEIQQLKRLELKSDLLKNNNLKSLEELKKKSIIVRPSHITPLTKEAIEKLKREGKLIEMEGARRGNINLEQAITDNNIFLSIHRNHRPQAAEQIPVNILQPILDMQRNEGFQILKKYVGSEKSKKCDRATASIGDYITFSSLASSIVLENFKDYKENCGLISLANYQSPFKDKISSRLVTFLDRYNNIHCTGFLIETNKVITARHCFKKTTIKKTPEFTILINDKWKTNTNNFIVKEISCNGLHDLRQEFGSLSMQVCDYVMIEIGKEIDLSASKMEISTDNNQYDKLVVFGYHRLNHLYEKKANNRSDYWVNGLAVADHEMCMVYQKQNLKINESNESCFSHGCQTIGGMSGAPIFKIIDEIPYFAGIQIGTTAFDPQAWKVSENESCNINSNNTSYEFINNLALKTNLAN